MDIAYFISIFVGILAIVNPFGNISFFSSLTQGFSVDEKKQVISKAILAATVTLIVFGLLGSYIFQLFSITIPAFRIAGGLLLFRVAFSMLYGSTPGTKSTHEEKEESLDREMVGIIPLAIPMLAGPGAISTVMLYVSEGNILDLSLVIISIFITMIITYILLKNADKIFSRIGRVGSLAISRIMGLILAAVAVQFLVNGIHDIALAWITEFSMMLT